ncbi:50S ribosomal protein L25 [Patescibacteria group bacterium]|nr:50S ribosomal protein L25 [Patescibacteria group bacterium]
MCGMDLQVQKREMSEKPRTLRQKGLIPAELYGKGIQNLHLMIPSRAFNKVYIEAGENTVVNAILDGEKYPVIINNVAYDGVSGDILNIDLYKVRMDEEIRVFVPIEFIGVSPAVKEKNGLLIKSIQEIEIEALPIDILHTIEVDISKLTEIDQSLYVKDLSVSKKVKILIDPETVIVTASAKVTEEEELAAQEAASADVEGVKVEAEEKVGERDAKKEGEVADVADASKPAGSPETPKK